MEIEHILEERQKTHGDYKDHARTTQALKTVFRKNCASDKLNPEQAEAVDMILHKLGRIAAGDPNYQDHWDDIAGYAKLASKSCLPR